MSAFEQVVARKQRSSSRPEEIGETSNGSRWLQKALETLEIAHYRHHGSLVSKGALYSVLQGCIKHKNLLLGRRAYLLSISSGIPSLPLLEDLFIRVFSVCGSFREAKQVFFRSHNPDLYAWHAIISAHIMHGDDHGALMLCGWMLDLEIEPDRVMLMTMMKACGNIGCIDMGRIVHNIIIRREIESKNTIGSCLIDMYGKCGSLAEAQRVADMLPIVKNVVIWGSLIASYVNVGLGKIALNQFEEMTSVGTCPDKFILSSVAKACGIMESSWKGKMVHFHVIESRLESDVIVGTSLIDMYGKCKSMQDACYVFNNLLNKNVTSWNALIAAYICHGYGFEALQLFEKMECSCIKANKITFLNVLKASGSIMAFIEGQLVHDQVIKNGLESVTELQNGLVDMYAKCGSLHDMYRMFNHMSMTDTTSWNTLIAGNLHAGDDFAALSVFQVMEEKGIEKNEFTLSCALKACSRSISTVEVGRIMHNQVICSGLQSDLVTESSLVLMYAKCGNLQEAHQILKNMVFIDVIAWNGLISGYVYHDQNIEALRLMEEMQKSGVSPNVMTFASILKACTRMDSALYGRFMHDESIRCSFETNELVVNGLIDMYANFGCLKEALDLFDRLRRPNLIIWNAMINGCVQHDEGLIALELFEKMHIEGICADHVTYVCALQACTSIGSVALGRMIHDHILRDGLETYTSVGTTLVNMYASCGSLKEAHILLDMLPARDVVSWSALIGGYAYSGHYNHVVRCLKDMVRDGIEPDGPMYYSILVACCHSGQVEEGYRHFKCMRDKYGLLPTLDHFHCMASLLSGAGQLDECKKLLETMPNAAEMCDWVSLLNACKTHKSVEVGRECFAQILIKSPSALEYCHTFS